MKTSSKKMAAEISSALTFALIAKSSRKKIMKRIDAAANRMAEKINKRIAAAPGGTKKEKQAKKMEKKEIREKRKTPETAAVA